MERGRACSVAALGRSQLDEAAKGVDELHLLDRLALGLEQARFA
jgi:hypothetical protein